MGRLTGLLGIVVILAVAWAFSRHKKAIKLRVLYWGLGLQFTFAILVLKTDFGKIFQAVSSAVAAMLVIPRRALRFCLAILWAVPADRSEPFLLSRCCPSSSSSHRFSPSFITSASCSGL